MGAKLVRLCSLYTRIVLLYIAQGFFGIAFLKQRGNVLVVMPKIRWNLLREFYFRY